MLDASFHLIYCDKASGSIPVDFLFQLCFVFAVKLGQEEALVDLLQSYTAVPCLTFCFCSIPVWYMTTNFEKLIPFPRFFRGQFGFRTQFFKIFT